MILGFESVSKTYQSNGRSVTALSDASLQLDAGQFFALRGKSGCGKSTLLLAAGGLLRPDHGRIMVDGTDLYSLSANQRAAFRARHVGFVFQQFHLVPYLNVLDNVLTSRLGTDESARSARERAIELIDKFGLLDRMSHRPGQLSTGERQRTALARAMLNSARLLLADEPTGNLDEENAEIVLNHLSEFASNGGAVLLVTHDVRAAGRAHRCIDMSEGRLLSNAQ